ncbi:MAG TPA: alpha/beta hydrolase [Micromonospora sp.]
MTFADLRYARLGPLAEAAQAWRAVAKAFDHVDNRCVSDLTGFLRSSGWQGDAATAALACADNLDDELEVVSMRARTTASVLRNAVEQFEDLRRRLLSAVNGAIAAGLRVDDDGRVFTSFPSGPHLTPEQELAERRALENAEIYGKLISRILDEATESDERTARALRALKPADDEGHSAWEYNKATEAAKAAAEALGLSADSIPTPGTDPKAVKDWWSSLSTDERQVLLTAFPERLGALDGLPAVDRDYANRLALRNFIGDTIANHRDSGNPEHERAFKLLERLEQSETNPPHKRLYLLSIDPVGDGKAAIAIGNPDTADHTAVLVPGVGTKLNDFRGQIGRANQLHDSALNFAPPDAAVSIIAWIGYDTPSIGVDIVSAPFGDKSKEGAKALDAFVDGLRAAHDDTPSHVTVIGHSYGSTVVGEAAKSGDGLAADDIIALGSPGMRVENASEFNVGGQHVWVGAAADDIIARPEVVSRMVPEVPGTLADEVARVGLRGLAHLANQFHGPPPHDPDFGGNVLHVDTSGHSGYWEDGSLVLHSQGAIIVGNYSEASLQHEATR